MNWAELMQWTWMIVALLAVLVIAAAVADRIPEPKRWKK